MRPSSPAVSRAAPLLLGVECQTRDFHEPLLVIRTSAFFSSASKDPWCREAAAGRKGGGSPIRLTHNLSIPAVIPTGRSPAVAPRRPVAAIAYAAAAAFTRAATKRTGRNRRRRRCGHVGRDNHHCPMRTYAQALAAKVLLVA